MVKKQKDTLKPIEKTLATAGIAIVIFGCLSSIFYWYVNQRFVYEPLSLVYYLNYLIILGGGFAIGYLLARKGSQLGKLYTGATYAFLTMLFYSLTFGVRFIVEGLFGSIPFPWGRIFFEGAPFIALIITFLVAYFLQFRRRSTSPSIVTMRTFVGIFLVAQLYDIGNLIYWSVTTPNSDSTSPLWLVIGGYLINPLAVALIAFLSFRRVKGTTQRLFSAAFIGTFSYILLYSLWNFRTDATAEATNVFQIVSVVILLVITGGLIWRISRQR